MRTPPKPIVKALARLDPRLSVQWNRARCRWEVFSTRANLPPSRRKRFVHACTFYADGVKCRIFDTKPTDRWHVMFWEGPQGQYRDLDMNLVDAVRARDMWQRGRLKDILDDDEKRLIRQHETENRRRREFIRDIVKEVDGPLRRDVFANGLRTRTMRHHPANWNISAPWKGQKALKAKTGRSWKVKV